MGGMVLETNMNEILLRIQEQEKMEKEEVRIFYFYFFIKNSGTNICMFYVQNIMDK